MNVGLVDRIKTAKDRMMSFLQTIRAEQVRLASEQERLNAMQTSLGENIGQILTKLNNLYGQVEDLTALSIQADGERRRQFEQLVAPINDPFSYPEDMEKYRWANPEVSLLQHLRSFVQTPNVLDVGANIGDVSEQLLSAGFRVFAFEPSPYAYEKLVNRLSGATGFKHFPLAIGAKDGNTSLFTVEITDEQVRQTLDADLTVYSTLVKHPMPDGLSYGTPLEVRVRSLKSLHDSGEIPGDVSIVKIDTEGGDLDVIRGMGNTKYAIIMTEFWDAAHYFSNGEFGLLQQTVLHLKNRGYPWHIVVYRVFDGTSSTEPRFYCNIDQSVRGSWGNALFFRDYDVFKEALKWCSAMLPANHSYGS